MGSALLVANYKAQALADPSLLEKELEAFAQLKPKIDALLAATVLDSNKAQLALILKTGTDYADACFSVVTGMTTMAQLDKTRGAAAQAVLDAAEKTSIAGLKDAQDVTVLTVARLVSAVIILIVGLAAAALIGIAIAIAITRAITRPISRASPLRRWWPRVTSPSS